MTKEITININNAEILSLEELDAVAGGTVKEFDEIIRAFGKYDIFKEFGGIAAHIPGANKCTVEFVESVLKEIGINADISIGYLGFGIGSDPNKYSEVGSGRAMTHSEVLSRIKQHVDSAYKSIGL